MHIGTNNRSKCWLQHHRPAEFESVGEMKIAWLEVSDSRFLLAIEKALIQYFKPSLNNRLVKVRKQKGLPGNPHPTSKMNRIHSEEIAESPLSVRLRVEIDNYVRSASKQN